MRFKNTNKGSIAYRDDAGKHYVDANKEFDLVGDQHAEAVLTIPGIVFVSGDWDPTPADVEAPEEVEVPVDEAASRKATVTVKE